MVSRSCVPGVALLCIVVLAGCIAPFGSDTRPDAPSPPGVDDGRLANASALVEAHRTSLQAAGFELVENASGRVTRYVAEPNFTAYRVSPAGTGRPAVWANETITLARERGEDGWRYHRPPRNWASPRLLTAAGRLQQFLAVGTYVRTGTRDCGAGRCAVLRANGSTVERFRNFTAVAVVDGDGVVREFEARLERESGDQTGPVRYSFQVRRYGNATVERPDWAEEGLDRTG